MFSRRHSTGVLLTVLLAVEVLDAVARLLVLTESGLVLRGIELRRFAPAGDLPLELVHCARQPRA